MFRTLILLALALGFQGLGCTENPRTLDREGRQRMVAALPKHSVPLTLDVSDGYTFSGVSRTTKTGAIESFEESLFGPFNVSGHSIRHILSWNRGEVDGFLNCDPTMAVHTITESITNTIVLHFTADAAGVPGEVTAVNVVIPTFQEQPPTTTSPFPIDALSVGVTLEANGNVVEGDLSPAAPPPGAQANFLVTFAVPLPVAGIIQVDVTLEGAVQPALGPPRTVDPGCPPPNDGLREIHAFGVSQLILENTFAVLFIEEAAPPTTLIIHPSLSTLNERESRDFSAFDCPVDGNGNPDYGPDGVPGTTDDLCTPKPSTQWSVNGNIGTVNPTEGSTTTLTPGLPPGSLSESGQVVATDGSSVATADVIVKAAQTFTVSPASADVPANGSRIFGAFSCPVDANGNPDFGPDGVPGTTDDLCTDANADWSTTGGIGTVSPLTGLTTTFTAADVPEGQTASGAVLARIGDSEAQATVLVRGRNEPTHRITFEVERMFRQGLPLVESVSAGESEVVVRPTTAHELDESLGTMMVGGTVLPFDFRASLLGELDSSTRTIESVSPPDLEGMRQAILDDLEASGGDPSNPSHVALFLRRNPDRGRVTLVLDAGVERDLDPAAGAWLGSLDAGFIELRPDLLLREAQVERTVRDGGQDRRIQIQVQLVENVDATNVLPYDDTLSFIEVRRLRRAIFQGHGVPGVAQLIAVNDGRGRGDGLTNLRDFAAIYAGVTGDGTDRSAHALAHVAGHLLFGAAHDRTSTLSIMHGDPANTAGAGDEFYTVRFDDFRYSDRTVRRGLRHLDRYWRREAQ